LIGGNREAPPRGHHRRPAAPSKTLREPEFWQMVAAGCRGLLPGRTGNAATTASPGGDMGGYPA